MQSITHFTIYYELMEFPLSTCIVFNSKLRWKFTSLEMQNDIFCFHLFELTWNYKVLIRQDLLIFLLAWEVLDGIFA